MATTSLVVNSNNVILDDIWHGESTTATAWVDQQHRDTGVVVNGDNVTAYGLFVEHYQKHEVV
jgi:hypothetical protein